MVSGKHPFLLVELWNFATNHNFVQPLPPPTLKKKEKKEELGTFSRACLSLYDLKPAYIRLLICVTDSKSMGKDRIMKS